MTAGWSSGEDWGVDDEIVLERVWGGGGGEGDTAVRRLRLPKDSGRGGGGGGVGVEGGEERELGKELEEEGIMV